ncbi:MAG: hypothetical protein HY762_03180 [Planctomycetes bacterium]|nr:hypothetical protein [Planctomycetota bacterium]
MKNHGLTPVILCARRLSRTLLIMCGMSFVVITGYGGLCSKSEKKPSSGSSVVIVSEVQINGTFAGGTHTRLPWFDRFFSNIFTTPAYALDQSLVTKVIAFMLDGRYVVSNVAADRSFSIGVEKGKPTGLIFVGAANNYLGYLTLKNGIDILPLMKFDTASGTNITTIDLQALSSSGGIIEPGHNPIGSELPLTAEEQTAIAQGDDFFTSVIKNVPDADGDGQIDFLNGKFYRPFVMYFVTGGSFSGNLTPSVTTPANITGFRFSLHVSDNSTSTFPDTVYFNGPVGSSLSNSANDQAPNKYTHSATYGSPYITSPTIPPGGVYTVTYNAGTLTFNIPNQSSAISNIILAVPTITLNGDGTIQKTNWSYKLGSGAVANVDPQTIIEYIMLQVDGQTMGNRIYNSPQLPPATTEHVFTSSVNWNNVAVIYMVYNDVFGNHYVVSWNKP